MKFRGSIELHFWIWAIQVLSTSTE